MIGELFVSLWAVLIYMRGTAHIAFHEQSVKLAPVMRKIRQGLVPVALLVVGFAPYTLAHSIPAKFASGSGMESRYVEDAPRNGISLDEAVRRAEQQFKARVVRTEVQDEDGRKVYVLKLLSENGRVFTVRIDAATGRMR